MLTGPDCSHHQGTVDWPRVRAAGHSFAIIKATDSVAYKWTSWFLTHAPRVEAAGLVLGCYHFLSDQHDGAAQARFFVDTVRKAGGFDGRLAVLDVETGPGGRPGIGRVREFAAEFRRLEPGHPLVIYTGAWYWVDILGNPRGSDVGPLWHSEYETTAAELADGPERGSYGGWAAPTIWQHTSTGSCPGVAGNCDLNRFDGDRAQLAALTGGDDMPLSTTDLDEIKTAMRLVLNEGTGPGQTTWKGTSAATLSTAQAAINILNVVRAAVAKLDGVDVDEAAIAAAVVPAVIAGLDPETLAAAIAEHLSAEDQSALLDALAARLAS